MLTLPFNPKAATCQNIQILLGGFETKTGEQWLAFRNDGKYSAADYAKVTSEKMSKYLGEQNLWNPFEKDVTIKRRSNFVLKLLQGAMRGLTYMHDHDRLHQSLGPASVVLNTMVEKDSAYLVPRLRDLAFSVDIRIEPYWNRAVQFVRYYKQEANHILPKFNQGKSHACTLHNVEWSICMKSHVGALPLPRARVRYSQQKENSRSPSDELWRRASAAGAFTPMEKRAFGIADDIYEAGLLFAYLAFIPFCEAGVMDSLSLRRLLENTFQLDLDAMREYCLADDRLLEAVKFLDFGAGAGWELLQAMLNRDFRKRPIADAVLSHRFMAGDFL